jgi:tetratricopeptide (TPR) repeat protein
MKTLMLALLLGSCATQLQREEILEEPSAKTLTADDTEKLLQTIPKDATEYPLFLHRQCQILETDYIRARQEASIAENEAYSNPKQTERQEKAKSLRAEHEAKEQELIECYRELVNGYPNYEKRDEAIYFLGFTLQSQSRESPEAIKLFETLSKEYPNSVYLSGSLLALADHYFNQQNDVVTALALYQRVVAIPEARERYFALYMTGWCHYNLSNFEEALSAFVRVAKDTAGKKESEVLAKEARIQVVMVYVHIGDPKKAEPFFASLGDTSQVPKMMMRLADRYYSSGKLKEFKDTCSRYNPTYKEMDEVCDQPDY